MFSTPTIHRPASDFDPLALLQAVREVAESSTVDDPRQISTRTWDQARHLSERFADAPSARRVCEHLGLSWEKIRALAFMRGHGQRIALGHTVSTEETDWLTEEYSDFALKLIARRLDVATLTPSQYRAERQVTGVDRDRSRPARQLRLPTPEQIGTLAGTWDQALAHAGLVPRHGLGGHRAHVDPTPIVEVLDRCYEHHRTEPTLSELALFARANGIRFPRKQRGRPYSAYVEEWKDARAARGLAVPDAPPPRSKRPDYSFDIGAAVAGERRAKSDWGDHQEVVEWVMRYLGEVAPRERTSQRAYDAWARQQDGAPWASVLQRHGGWIAVREEAWTKLGRETGVT